MSDDDAYFAQQFRRVVDRSSTDLSLRPYLTGFKGEDVIWSRTLEGCRGDLADGRYCEITPAEVRFGNIKFGGNRRTPL